MAKYKRFPVIKLENRQWPNCEIVNAPIWCSVDLRDGNQSLPTPMTVYQKLEMFEMLVKCGFKEIEVGFPAASETEFLFVRRLIEENRIPNDVTIQVLVQAREDLIKRTVESLIGAHRVIIHLYNSTSPVQRSIVFGLEKSDILTMAVQGVKWVKQYSAKLYGTEVFLQYSPESFSATEIEFSLKVCEAAMNEWQPTPERKIILNLPETVQVAMPNVYADQIEWFCKNVKHRDSAVISVHTHNDRGTGVASTELAVLAGAERVEGTLFGNGERTGNVDIIILALNLFTQGINPHLDFSNLDSIRVVYERCTGMTVHARHPYSGELVFTAFSGSHQDAIRKGLKARIKDLELNASTSWEVPYLPIDPADLGRTYKEVIRVNGQSGKGGIAHLLERDFGIQMPKNLEREFGNVAGKKIDALGREATPEELREILWTEFVDKSGPYILSRFESTQRALGCSCAATVIFNDKQLDLVGWGNGPIDAFVTALSESGVDVNDVLEQSEHALGGGKDALAIAYICLQFLNKKTCWGIGVSSSIELASIRAVVSALNRS